MKDIESPGAFEARNDVPYRVIPRVADVQSTGWVGKHLKDVIFWFFRLFGRAEDVSRFPGGAPPRLYLFWIVSCHRLNDLMLGRVAAAV